jgi:tRNA1(Val) A37 N6-methylase TrmN6
MGAESAGVSADAVLGGSLTLRQPLRGHRVGHDAILLAAASAAGAGEHAVDLGAGVGAAGLALARRVAGVAVTLVEIEPALAALARENAARNGLAERVRAVCLDVAAPAAAFAAAGLSSGTADRVLMNPPFNTAPAQKLSPDRGRRLAHAASPDTLGQWVRTAVRLLRPSGVLTLIWRADGIAEVLAALDHGFGSLEILPVHGDVKAPANRILIRATKGGRAPTQIHPALMLNDESGVPNKRVQEILAGKGILPLAHP